MGARRLTHSAPRDRQIRNCVMIHKITAAVIKVAIAQLMTVIAHIVANAFSYG